MHSVTLLQDLAVVLLVAGVVTVLFHRLRQPVVLGYILAGVIIGPHTPPYALIHDEATIRTLAELGVVLLMFSLGLEFNLRKLKRVGAAALIAALLEILLLFWVGYEIGRFFGWRMLDSVFLGAMLSMSSTTIIIKVLGELGRMKERFAQLIFGILIIEDILGIAMIALLSGIAMTGRLTVGEVSLTLGKLAVFLVVSLVAGLLLVPRLLGSVARCRSNEMLVVTVLGLCFGVALLAAKLGYSVALGAFVIGAVVAEARELPRIEALLEPIRDMFSAIFFVAIGLLIDPRLLLIHWQPVLVITLAVIVGKVLTCSLGAFVGGHDARTSLRVGMGLAQIGEFSFIIASLGVSLKVTSEFLYPIVVGVSAITTLLTPYLIRGADGVVAWAGRTAPRSIVGTLAVYTRWVGELGQRPSSLATRLMRKWSLQMGLNVALITAVFIIGGFVGQHPPAWLPPAIPGEAWLKAAVWFGAAVLALPMFIATVRKLQALGLLVAELKVKESVLGQHTAAIRNVVAMVIPAVGTVVLGLYVVVLSSALLPSFKVLLALLGFAALLSWLLRRSFIRVYSRAQAALEETLAQPPPAVAPPDAPATHPKLREANLATVVVPPASPAVGRLLRELELRTRTGATVVAIERPGTHRLNPGADEEILAGDELLLLGHREQLDAARQLLLAAGPLTPPA